MISLLTGPLGLALRYPLITGLLCASLAGMSWSYLKGREHVAERHREAERRAVEQDTRENKRIQRAAEADEKEHDEIVEKSRKATEQEIEKITRISPHQCLDIKLSDIGLQ